MLDYKLVEALAAVCREGGFDRAAKTLLITQSAVSQRVRLLEDQLGLPLVVRSTPPEPTAVGATLIGHFNRVKQLEQELTQTLELSREGEFTALPIGVNEDSMATWFMEAISGLARDSGFTLHVSVDDQDETHKLLRRGDVMACVSARSDQMQGCSTTYLGRIDYLCLASRPFTDRWFADGVDSESLSLAPAVLYSPKDRSHDRFLAETLGLGKLDYPHHFIPSSHGFLDAISSGLGYGLVPHLQADTLLAKVGVIDLTPGLAMPVHLYWHHWDLEAGPIKQLTSSLVAYARETFPQHEEKRGPLRR